MDETADSTDPVHIGQGDRKEMTVAGDFDSLLSLRLAAASAAQEDDNKLCSGRRGPQCR